MCQPSLCVLPWLLALLPAQEEKEKAPPPIPARAFLPADYQNIIHVDLVALRERGIWDELESSFLGAVFRSMEREAGFPLSSLDRLTASAVIPDEQAEESQAQEVFVFEGNCKLDWPPSVRSDNYLDDEIGGHRVRKPKFEGPRPRIYAQPRPELQIYGSRALIEPVLSGKPNPGTSAADVMSLLSGRGDNLVYFVIAVDQVRFRQRLLARTLGDIEWPEDDPPTYVMLRVRAVGEADDPHLELHAALRHRTGKEGAAATETAAKAWIAKLEADPQLAAAKKIWSKVVFTREGPDVCGRVDLGRVRDAIGVVAVLFSKMVPQTETREVVVPKPVAAPPQPRGGGK